MQQGRRLALQVEGEADRFVDQRTAYTFSQWEYKCSFYSLHKILHFYAKAKT